MEPRGIAIPLATDTFIFNRTLSGTFSAGSVPIRAPLTIDDDDDSGSVTDDEYNNSVDSSDASGYSKELDSGIDEEDLGEELGGGIGDGSDFSGGSVIFRPFVGDFDEDEETLVNYSSFEEESDESDEVEGVSESEVSEVDGVSVQAKIVIPRAILSLDDDEFDEILGSDEEEDAMLLPLTKASGSGDEETLVEDKTLQYEEDIGIAEEPVCFDSVIGDVISSEEEAMSLSVTSGGSSDFVVDSEENFAEASMGLCCSSKQLIERGVAQRSITKDGGRSIPEVIALGSLEDSAVELGGMGLTDDKPEFPGSVTGELVSAEEDIVQVKYSDYDLGSLETGLHVTPRDYIESPVESEGNTIDAGGGLSETFCQLVEEGVGEGSMSTESYMRIDDGRACKIDISIIPSGDEDTGNLIDEAKERCENYCGAVSKLGNLGMSSEIFQLTPAMDSVTTRNLEDNGGMDVVVSGCGSSDDKADQETGNEVDNKADQEYSDRNLSLPDEDRGASSSRISFETANESVENGDQIDKQVNLPYDNEPDQISVKDVERTRPGACVIASDVLEKETQMARLILNHSFVELDEYEETGYTGEKLSGSTFQNCSEELSTDHSLQLISEKVKERVEKSKLLKEKLDRIIGRIDPCSGSSAVTEVKAKLSLAGEEHQTSLGFDYMSDETKIIKLPEQDLEFSINVLVIGKTGVGKSATVNSIFGETKSPVGAFGVTTKSPNLLVGNVRGIQIRILDTPGLMSSATEQPFNQEILISIKKTMKTFPVDVVLYVDRLDENPDIHLLRIITTSLGLSIWRKVIVVLTHAASEDGSGSLSYKDFIAERFSFMHQSIRQAVPELHRSKMPEIVLAENNNTSESTCLDWRLKLLILCCSVKLKSKEDSLLVEKFHVSGSPLGSFTLFCSLWNAFSSLEGKKMHLLDSHPEVLWDEQIQECKEQEECLVESKEAEEEGRFKKGLEEGTGIGLVGTKRRRLGFQATKRFGIYLDTPTVFSIGSRKCTKEEQEEQGKMLVRMRGSMSILGLVPMLISVFTTCVYGRKNI